MRRRNGTLYPAVGTLAAVAYFTVPGMRGNGLVFSLIGLSAATAIIVGALRNRPKPLLPWLLFAAAQASFVVGDLLYYAFDFGFPSLGDAFYLAVYPLLIGGLLILIRARTPGKDRDSLLDAAIITVGLGLLAWVFLIEPYTHAGEQTLLSQVISVSYPLMDVLLLAVVVRLAVGSGTRPLSFYLIGIGVVSLLATDAAYGYIELHSGYTQGGLLDAGWLAYYVLWGTAALHPGMARLADRSTGARAGLTGRRLVPLAAATLVAPAVGIIQSAGDGGAGFSVAAATSAVLFLLVLARMIGLVRDLRRSVEDEQRALFREGVLRRAAVALGGAPDRRAIDEVTAAATRDLLSTVDQVDGEDLPSALGASVEALKAQVAVAVERAALSDDLLRRRSEERMAAIVQHASDVITIVDADLTVQYQSSSAARFLRYPPETLAGSRLVDLVHPEDRASADAFFDSLVACEGVQPEIAFRVRRGDGAWVPVEAVGNNLLQDPSVMGIVVTIRDVSKRVALEDGLKLQVEELEKLDQMKTDLVCTVSHELRTPLTAIVGHVEMLSAGDLGELNAEQQWAVEAIDRNSNRLLNQIEDLLILAKIETEGLGLSLAATNVPALVHAVAAAISPTVAARSIDFRVDVGPGLDALPADESRLERALTNLLSNAVKFTPEGGRVGLTASTDGDDAVFVVSDTGIGMSAEDKDRLFTRFFRSHLATSMAIQGTGLGLAIVKRIVDDHGGSITVDSTLGAGTTVTFTVPLRPTLIAWATTSVCS